MEMLDIHVIEQMLVSGFEEATGARYVFERGNIGNKRTFTAEHPIINGELKVLVIFDGKMIEMKITFTKDDKKGFRTSNYKFIKKQEELQIDDVKMFGGVFELFKEQE